MANIKSAEKRIKVIRTKTGFNKSRKSAIKTYIVKFEEALAENKIDEAKDLLKTISKKIDQAASKNVLHKNNAAKKVSRLQKKLNKAI